MALMLPPFPKMPPLMMEIAIQHREAIEDAAVDPEAYFGEDAPEDYATSEDAQITDFLDRVETYANTVADHRYATAANLAMRRIVKAWAAIKAAA